MIVGRIKKRDATVAKRLIRVSWRTKTDAQMARRTGFSEGYIRLLRLQIGKKHKRGRKAAA